MKILPEDSSWLSFQLPPAEPHPSARTDPIGCGRNSCRQDRLVITLSLLGPPCGPEPSSSQAALIIGSSSQVSGVLG